MEAAREAREMEHRAAVDEEIGGGTGGPATGPAPSSLEGELRSAPLRALGVAVVAAAAVVLVRLVRGVVRARSAITEYESAHGPVPIGDGRLLDHESDALRALCDELGGSAGFLYPFGVLVFTVPFLLFVAGALLIWRHVLPVRATIAAFVVCAVTAIWAARGTQEIITILE